MVGKARKCFQLSLEGVVGTPFGTTFKMINMGNKNTYKLQKMALDELKEATLFPGEVLLVFLSEKGGWMFFSFFDCSSAFCFLLIEFL